MNKFVLSTLIHVYWIGDLTSGYSVIHPFNSWARLKSGFFSVRVFQFHGLRYIFTLDLNARFLSPIMGDKKTRTTEEVNLS